MTEREEKLEIKGRRAEVRLPECGRAAIIVIKRCCNSITQYRLHAQRRLAN